MIVIRRWLAGMLVLAVMAGTAGPTVASPQDGKSDKSPLKVFILAGQSNMQGAGVIKMDRKKNEGKGSLEYLVKDPKMAGRTSHLIDADGNWVVRDDVWIWYFDRKGGLSAGYGAKETTIGPEFGFGHGVGEALDGQVLLIKTAWGGKSLAVDFRPPSAGGEVGPFYAQMMKHVQSVLKDIKVHFPEYDGRGYELVGFGWHQGWNDRVNQAHNDAYEQNMVHFIRDVRKELGVKNLPFVIAETGMSGHEEKHPRALSLMKAQAAVAQYDEFKGNVAFVGTKDFFRPKDESPSGQAYHWNNNAETYFLIGDGMAKAMLGLLKENADGPATSPDAKQQQQVENWLQGDSNKDGKLSKDETDGLQKRFFDRNDRNQDGFLDVTELKVLAKRLATNQANRMNQANRTNQANQNRNAKGSVTTDQLRRKVPEGVTLVPDIEYRKGHQRWKLDLLMPTELGTKPRPAIVFVHGGGWRNGDKRKANFIDPAIEFASKGYVCISVNYRFTPEVPINDIVGDVKCAVRWLRAHADKYNVDPERFGAYGNSAGAHLVSMLGICTAEAGMEGDGPWQEHTSMVQAVCASATPTSFLIPMNDRMRSRSQTQNTEAKADSSSDQPGTNQKSKEGGIRNAGDDARPSPRNSFTELARKKISPSHYVTADAPPFLLIHDESDKTVSVQQAKTFVAALKKAGAKDVTFKLYDNQSGHGVMQKNIAETGPLREAFFDRTLRGSVTQSPSGK